jgi:hypothetical protein
MIAAEIEYARRGVEGEMEWSWGVVFWVGLVVVGTGMMLWNIGSVMLDFVSTGTSCGTCWHYAARRMFLLSTLGVLLNGGIWVCAHWWQRGVGYCRCCCWVMLAVWVLGEVLVYWR